MELKEENFNEVFKKDSSLNAFHQYMLFFYYWVSIA